MASHSVSPVTPPGDTRGLRSAFIPFGLLLKLPAWMPVLLGFVILGLTITSQSIDMDEAQTWDYARLTNISDVFTELRNDPNSESQMPLGMLLSWAWARIFGTSEYALRSINLVWAAIALTAFAYIARRVSISWLPLLFAIQPFLWYSMDHARTPVMQMAGGSLLLLATLDFMAFRGLRVRAAAVLCLGAVFLCGASMLGVGPLAAVGVGLTFLLVYRRIALPRSAKILLFVTAAFLAVLGLYYLSTLMRGAGGAKIWSVSPANALFAIYEFMGFQGLGPGRQHLREIIRGVAPISALLPFLLGLFSLAVVYLGLFFLALKSWFTRPFHDPVRHHPSLFTAWLMGIGVASLSLIILFVLAGIVDFPFWGRHMAGAFPFWILTLAITIRWARQGLWRTTARRMTWALLFLLGLSALLIRFAPQHRHDDYRSAAAAAAELAAAGHSVWWVADQSGGEYYDLTFEGDEAPLPGKINYAPNRTVQPSPLPSAILISRPDNFDRSDLVGQFLRTGVYDRTQRFQTFDVWLLGQTSSPVAR